MCVDRLDKGCMRGTTGENEEVKELITYVMHTHQLFDFDGWSVNFCAHVEW